MDDRPTQESDKPSAKVLPFTTESSPHSIERMKEPPIPHELLGAISQAVDEAPWARTTLAETEALEDEHVFRKRFGFVVNRSAREKIFALKRGADLTDREIRLLWRTCSLDLNGEEAKITASRIFQIWGHIQMASLALLMFMGILAAVKTTDHTVQQFVALAAVECFLPIFLLGIEYVYVRPYQIMRRVLSERSVIGQASETLDFCRAKSKRAPIASI